MDKKTKEQLLASGFKRVDMPLTVGSYEAFDKSFAFNDTTIDLDPDLMYVKFILCHEGTNSNGDHFTKEVLANAQFTPRMKPIDWEHGQPILGTMLDSVYKEDGSGIGYIEAVGVIWKFLYPELSGDIKKKAATGELKLSMECYYREANYKAGDTLYTHEEAQNLGLIQYVGREYMGSKVTRVFSEVIFGGVGVVASPADKGAVFLSVAKDLSKRGIEVNTDNIEEITQAVAEAINRKVNDFANKQPNKDTIEAVAIARYVKAFDKGKSAIVDRFNKDVIKTKDQMVSEIRSIIDTFLSEVATINSSYYKGVASEEDKSQAGDIFFDEVQSKISNKLFAHYQGFDESLEAYLLRVSEDYFIYELVDYSQSYPDSVKLLKGFYSIVDGEVQIHFEKAIEVEMIYQEKAAQNLDESEEELVTKVKTENAELETILAGEEVIEAVKTEEVIDAVDYEAKASDLETTVADLTTKLSDAQASNTSLESRIAELEGQLGEIEADKVAHARKAELEGLGIVLSEARQAKLKGMNDEEYTDFKDLLVEVAGTKVEATKVEETVEEEILEAEASEVVEEEITVETEKASAGLNIESDNGSEIKPFGHLA